MTDPAWLRLDVVLAIHDAQLAEHGGPAGVRDMGLLEAALARPRQLIAYGEPDLADLAVAAAFGLLRNHPFVDGNKRTALVVLETFLALNGRALRADDAACVETVLAAAAGNLSEPAFAEWVRAHLAPA